MCIFNVLDILDSSHLTHFEGFFPSFPFPLDSLRVFWLSVASFTDFLKEAGVLMGGFLLVLEGWGREG